MINNSETDDDNDNDDDESVGQISSGVAGVNLWILISSVTYF